jgi:hypothetical protein
LCTVICGVRTSGLGVHNGQRFKSSDRKAAPAPWLSADPSQQFLNQLCDAWTSPKEDLWSGDREVWRGRCCLARFNTGLGVGE